jgi:drug/metabolite transporter superfamily protein YnfA
MRSNAPFLGPEGCSCPRQSRRLPLSAMPFQLAAASPIRLPFLPLILLRLWASSFVTRTRRALANLRLIAAATMSSHLSGRVCASIGGVPLWSRSLRESMEVGSRQTGRLTPGTLPSAALQRLDGKVALTDDSEFPLALGIESLVATPQAPQIPQRPPVADPIQSEDQVSHYLSGPVLQKAQQVGNCCWAQGDDFIQFFAFGQYRCSQVDSGRLQVSQRIQERLDTSTVSGAVHLGSTKDDEWFRRLSSF